MSAVISLAKPRFRLMKESDLSRVMEIEASVYIFPWSIGIFNDCIKVGYNCWVLEEYNNIIGYAVMSVALNEVHILNISIDLDYQNQGLGRFFMLHLCKIANDFRADTILLEVRPSNFAAVHLYHTLGFNEVGLRKNYYPGTETREDALIMAKSIF